MALERIQLDLIDCDITYYPNFIENLQANVSFNHFRSTIPWQQDDIKVFGKVYQQPRLTAMYGSVNKSYSYSNIVMRPRPFTQELMAIKKKLESVVAVDFNACLLNRYRDGKDSNGWHSDDEKELGQNPIIASISLGQERPFKLRHKKNKALRHKIILENGSLLLMKGKTQHFWQHQIPKTSKAIGERINLTFRILK